MNSIFLKINDTQIRAISSFLLFVGTIKLCWSSVQWIGAAFTGMHDQFNLVILFALIVIIIKQLKQNSISLNEFFSSRLNPFAVLLYVIGLLSYYLLKTLVDINLLSAFCFGVLLYALVGFYIAASNWKKLAIPSFLIILTLPFGSLMDTYLGFPLRMAAADLVHQLLLLLDYNSINTETIITLENRSTQINMNCSGMKGLWVSWIYFFMLSWIYRVRLDFKWFLLLIFSTSLVLFFNLLRIVLLVFLELVFDQREIADSIHTPLGLAGFVLSCLITWTLVFYKLKVSEPKSSKIQVPQKKELKQNLVKKSRYSLVVVSSLGLVLVGLILIKPSPNIKKESFTIPQIDFPENIITSDLPLTQNEKFFFAKDACFPIKRKFKYNGLEGTFLCVFNASFRGHHHPEACMQGAGFEIGEASTLLVNEHFPIKKIMMNDDSLTSTYWFQAPGLITEEYSSRVWLELLGKQKRWVMVSILFNKEVDSNDKNYREFLKIISNQINNNLLTLSPQDENF